MQPIGSRIRASLVLAGCGSGILLGSCAMAPVAAPLGPLSELAGRSAGAPQRCVTIESGEGLRVGNANTILYGRGKTVWANALAPTCSFSRGATLIVEPLGARYCHGDYVRAVDPHGFTPRTACRLGDFVPYVR